MHLSAINVFSQVVFIATGLRIISNLRHKIIVYNYDTFLRGSFISTFILDPRFSILRPINRSSGAHLLQNRGALSRAAHKCINNNTQRAERTVLENICEKGAKWLQLVCTRAIVSLLDGQAFVKLIQDTVARCVAAGRKTIVSRRRPLRPFPKPAHLVPLHVRLLLIESGR